MLPPGNTFIEAELLAVSRSGTFNCIIGIRDDLREAIIAACETGELYRAISTPFGGRHSTVRKINKGRRSRQLSILQYVDVA